MEKTEWRKKTDGHQGHINNDVFVLSIVQRQNGSGDRSIPPNDALGGIKANKDNDPYGLAICEGISSAESSGGRTKR